jgi:hypothetical protein
MRKRLVPHELDTRAGAQWLDLSSASVEVTSEDPAHPIEHALLRTDDEGWRAGQPGVQRVRILFDAPQTLQRIRVEFVETETQRTQEFVLRWSTGEAAAHEIVRQQWNFSPGGSARETEEYEVRLTGVRMLELTVTPDIGGGAAYASLRRLCLA